MAQVNDWSSSSYSTPTHRFDCTIRSFEDSYLVRNPNSPCRLWSVRTSEGAHLLDIPCFACSGHLLSEHYIQLYKRQFSFALSSGRNPPLPPSWVADLANSFMACVECARCSHSCLRLGRNRISTTHIVQIDIHVRPLTLMQEMINVEESPRIRTTPATKESVRGLLEARTEEEEFEQGHGRPQCVICLEDIETRMTSLKMPCSHTFHESCLVQWLDNNHVCPLCRFEMPIAKKR